MNLEQQFRNELAGQLSDDKTEVDVKVAAKIAREFASTFSVFCAENYEYYPLHKAWLNKLYLDGNIYTTDALLKIYEDEVYCK